MEDGGPGYGGEADDGPHFEYVLVEDGLYYIVAIVGYSSGDSDSHRGKEISDNSQTNIKNGCNHTKVNGTGEGVADSSGVYRWNPWWLSQGSVGDTRRRGL